MAMRLCCTSGHTGRYENREHLHVRDENIIPFVRSAIDMVDSRTVIYREMGLLSTATRYTAAADKLRDFATVELLCEGLGITRKELN